MSARPLIALALPAVLALTPLNSMAQATATTPPAAGRSQPTVPSRYPERPVRRDIPMTNMIKRAFAAGTRDSTGRPGRNYWQLWTDYKINARLDTATSRISGHETIVLRNNSDSVLNRIVMRLDQNIFAANVPRDDQVPEITDGMKITKLSVDGQAADLNEGAVGCLGPFRPDGSPPPPLQRPRATELAFSTGIWA